MSNENDSGDNAPTHHSTGSGDPPYIAPGDIVMYGLGPQPLPDWPPRVAPDKPPIIDFDKPAPLGLKKKLRIAVRIGTDGQLHVLVSVDGVKLAEASTEGSTITLEQDL